MSTDYLGLTLPPDGEALWGEELRENFRRLDAAIGLLNALSGDAATYAYPSSITVQGGRVLRVSEGSSTFTDAQLPSVGAAGSYAFPARIVVDAKGRVTGVLAGTDGSGAASGSEVVALRNVVSALLARVAALESGAPPPTGTPTGPGSVPVGTITVSFTTAKGAGRSYSFSGLAASSSGSRITSWQWTFGDGTTAQGQNVTHTYPAAGTFNVRLTVSAADGGVGSAVQGVVNVNGPLVVTSSSPPGGAATLRYTGNAYDQSTVAFTWENLDLQGAAPTSTRLSFTEGVPNRSILYQVIVDGTVRATYTSGSSQGSAALRVIDVPNYGGGTLSVGFHALSAETPERPENPTQPYRPPAAALPFSEVALLFTY